MTDESLCPERGLPFNICNANAIARIATSWIERQQRVQMPKVSFRYPTIQEVDAIRPARLKDLDAKVAAVTADALEILRSGRPVSLMVDGREVGRLELDDAPIEKIPLDH